MPPHRPPLRPDLDGCGLSGGDPAEVAALVATAWNGMIELAGMSQLTGPSRLEGRSVREVLVPLGSWEEHQPFAALIEDARQGRVHELDDPGARDTLLTAAHHDAPVGEIVAALEAARDQALDFLTGEDAEVVGSRLTEAAPGQLPVTAVILGSAFELAVGALDITGPEEVPADVLDAGVAALTDLVGALSARRGLTTTVAVVTPQGGWATGTQEGSWATMPLQPGTRARDLGWPAVEGRAHDILDAAAGRRLGAQLVLTRRLRPFDLPGLIRLSSALEAVPGLPGGSALRTGAQTLGQTGRLVGRVRHLLRGN